MQMTILRTVLPKLKAQNKIFNSVVKKFILYINEILKHIPSCLECVFVCKNENMANLFLPICKAFDVSKVCHAKKDKIERKQDSRQKEYNKRKKKISVQGGVTNKSAG